MSTDDRNLTPAEDAFIRFDRLAKDDNVEDEQPLQNPPFCSANEWSVLTHPGTELSLAKVQEISLYKPTPEAIAYTWQVNQWFASTGGSFPTEVVDKILDYVAYGNTPIEPWEADPEDSKKWGTYRIVNGRITWVIWPKTREHTLRSIRAIRPRYAPHDYDEIPGFRVATKRRWAPIGKRVVSVCEGIFRGRKGSSRTHAQLRESIAARKIPKAVIEDIGYSKIMYKKAYRMSDEEFDAKFPGGLPDEDLYVLVCPVNDSTKITIVYF